jgi:hypothetical protein
LWLALTCPLLQTCSLSWFYMASACCICHIILCIWKDENRVKITDRCAPWIISIGVEMNCNLCGELSVSNSPVRSAYVIMNLISALWRVNLTLVSINLASRNGVNILKASCIDHSLLMFTIHPPSRIG